jgi:hypothetical protein
VVILPLWCWPLLVPLIAVGLLVWGAIGLVGLYRAALETWT